MNVHQQLATPRRWRSRAGVGVAVVATVAFALVMWGYLFAHVAGYWTGDREDLREDFAAYYAAASLVEQGLPDAIYDPDAVADMEESFLGRPAGRSGGLVFLNPPFIAGMLQPITGLPYRDAQAVWFAITALSVVAAEALLWPELRKLPRPWGFLFALGAVASLPVFWSLLYAQLTPFVLLSWAGFYRLYVSKREGAAGLVLALSLVKAHLAIGPLLYLVVKGRWRALGGFAIGAAIFAGASVAFVGWDGLVHDYPALLVESLSWQTEYGVNRAHMLSWSALLVRLFPELSLLAKMGVSLALSVVTLVAACLIWRKGDRLDDGVVPVLTLAVATVLASPHVHLQDMQIFVLPAAVLVAMRRDAIGAAGALVLLFAIPAASFGPNVAAAVLGVVLLGLMLATEVVPRCRLVTALTVRQER